MRLTQIKLISAIILTLFLVTPTFADNIGYVDMQKIFLNYTETKKAQTRFQEKQKELQKEYESRQKKVIEARKNKADEKEIGRLIEDMEKELQPKQQELIRLNNELTANLRVQIISASKRVAKEYGIDIIIDKQAVLYGGFDLTDFVLDKLNN